MIIRDIYLNKIKSMIDTEFVKVITGVRRSGKSFLLKMIEMYIKEQSDSSKQVVYLNFEHPDNFDKLQMKTLYDYLKENVDTKKKVYFMFDEIQEVENWQKLVNGLRVAFDCDIYIIGSNASLLSGEMATYLTGRYIEIKVLPLSFNEFLKFNDEDINLMSKYDLFFDYGGFPSVVLQEDKQLKLDVLNGIYNSILLKDVATRAIVKEPEALIRIALFLLDNVGQKVNTNKIANTLRSNGRKISNNTVENYLKLLEDSYLFYKVRRFDIKGKEYLSTKAKYYTVDLGLITSQLKKINSNYGSRLENLVYLELIRRGYDVFTADYEGKEIDFVATNNQETLYIQVTAQMPKESNRELGNLINLPTGHKKMLITGSYEDVGEIEGIKIIHIIDFLNNNGI